MRNTRRKNTQTVKVFSRLTLESLEERRLLAGDLAAADVSDSADRESRFHRVETSELMERVNFDNISSISSQFYNDSGDSIFMPTVVGGSATGTPPDTPADRLDPNSPVGSEYAGVVSIDIQHPTLGQFICTGSMVSPIAVLTAAHCFDLEEPVDGQVDPGVTATIYVNDGGNQTSAHSVSAITAHPDYDGFSNSGANDDLAVLQLATSVPVSTPIYPIRDAGIAEGELIEFVGYGQSGNGDVGFSSVDPNFFDKRVGANLAELFVVDDELGEVDEIFLFDFDENTGVDSGFLGGTTLGNDIEASVGQGDSGAPAFVDVNGQLVIAGVVTFEFALSNITPPPGEFGSLGGGVISGPYVPWINSLLGPPTADLQVSIRETANTIIAGSGAGNLQYEVDVTNLGPTNSTNITLDQLFSFPPGVTLDSVSTTSGTYAAPTWTIPTVPAGNTETLTFTLTVDGTAPVGLNLIATNSTITGFDQNDGNGFNNTFTEFTSIGPPGSGTVDIAISQTESADPVEAGSGSGNLVYTVTAENIGTDVATGLTVENPLTLPPGTTLVSATPSAGTFSGSTWTVGSLGANNAETLTVVITVDSTATAGVDVINSTAFVSALNETDSDVSNDTSAIATSVDPAVIIETVDLFVTQTESVDPVVAGSGTGNLVYTIDVTNIGTGTATGVEVDSLLTLPAGVSVDSVTPSVGTFAGTTWTVGSLAPLATEILTVVLTVDGATVPGIDVIQSSAFVSALVETDTNSANDGAVEATSVDPQPIVGGVVDVSVTQTESIDPAGFGIGNLVYTISATNAGTLPVSGVTIDEVLTLPAGVTVDSIVPSGGSFAGDTWTVGNLAVGTTETLTVTLSISTSAQQGTDVIQSSATLTGLNEVDTNPANDSTVESTSIQDLGVDIAISQTESATTIVPGESGNFVYTVTAANLGTTIASSVIIQDTLTLPPGVTLNSAFASSGLFFGDTWIINSLPGGTQETLTLTLTADASAAIGDIVSNIASLSFLGGIDGNPANNASTETTPIGSVSTDIDIAISQIESVDPVTAGSGTSNLVYTIAAENMGAVEATGLSIDAVLNLPAGATIESALPSFGSYVNSIWSVGTLAAGSTETLTISVTVDSSAVGGADAITSSVAVASVNELDTDPTNDSSTESTTILPASNAPQTAASVSVFGTNWAVSNHSLTEGANATLPWFGINQMEIVVASTQAQAPTLVLEGPTAGSAVNVTLDSWDGNFAVYSMPDLTDGFYKATVAGEEYNFSVLVADMSQNGSVGFDDFAVLASVFGTPTTVPFVADVDADGLVGFGDFSFLASNFAASLTSFVAPTPPVANSDAAAWAVDQIFAADEKDDEDEELLDILI